MSVEQFLETLEHPLKQEILTLRQIILAAAPQISEEIKWNAPSFRTHEHFATFHLRAKKGVQIILHLGAKARETAVTGIAIHDPQSLLTWLAKDRASVTFSDMEQITNQRQPFSDLIREWIAHV